VVWGQFVTRILWKNWDVTC